MTKDNAERVQKVIGKFVERLEWSTSSLADWAQEMLCGYVLVLVNKAERWGAKKERKSHRPCIHCPACGRLIALIPLPEMNREPQPPFDVEKVKGLLHDMFQMAYGSVHPTGEFIDDYEIKIGQFSLAQLDHWAHHYLDVLHELGIDDD